VEVFLHSLPVSCCCFRLCADRLALAVLQANEALKAVLCVNGVQDGMRSYMCSADEHRQLHFSTIDILCSSC
jgi:hypothetical protein